MKRCIIVKALQLQRSLEREVIFPKTKDFLSRQQFAPSSSRGKKHQTLFSGLFTLILAERSSRIVGQ